MVAGRLALTDNGPGSERANYRISQLAALRAPTTGRRIRRVLFVQREGTLSHMVDPRSILLPAQRVGSLQVWSLPALLDGFTVQLPLPLKLPIMLGTQ